MVVKPELIPPLDPFAALATIGLGLAVPLGLALIAEEIALISMRRRNRDSLAAAMAEAERSEAGGRATSTRQKRNERRHR